MVRKKGLQLWQIWHVERARPRSRRTDGDGRCYQIVAGMVRGGTNYWVAVDTTVDPPMRAGLALFDDYGREVAPGKAMSRVLSKRCTHQCFFKTRNPQFTTTRASRVAPRAGNTDGARTDGCRFCRVVAPPLQANSLAYSIRDGNPVTPLHTLVIPRRHVESFFDLRGAERNAVFSLLDQMKSAIQRQDGNVEGFNIGVNDGEAAGQSVPHVHVHLIPRRRGDVDSPRGGVRGVIPRKAGC